MNLNSGVGFPLLNNLQKYRPASQLLSLGSYLPCIADPVTCYSG